MAGKEEKVKWDWRLKKSLHGKTRKKIVKLLIRGDKNPGSTYDKLIECLSEKDLIYKRNHQI